MPALLAAEATKLRGLIVPVHRRLQLAGHRYVTHLGSARNYLSLWLAAPLCAAIAWSLAHVLFGSAAVYAMVATLVTVNTSHAQAWRSGLSYVTAIALSLITAHFARLLFGVNGLSLAVVIIAGLTVAWMFGIGADGVVFATVNSALLFTGAGVGVHSSLVRMAALMLGVAVGIAGSRILLARSDVLVAAEVAVAEHSHRLAELLHEMARTIESGPVGPAALLQRARDLAQDDDPGRLLKAARDEASIGLIGAPARLRLTELEGRWESLQTSTNRARRMARSLRDIGNPAGLPVEVADAVEMAADAVQDGFVTERIDETDVVAQLREASTGVILLGSALTADAILIVDEQPAASRFAS
jgi:hypothetical protein